MCACVGIADCIGVMSCIGPDGQLWVVMRTGGSVWWCYRYVLALDETLR